MSSVTTTVESSKSSPRFAQIVGAALAGGAVAAVANLAVYGLARAVGVDFLANYAGPEARVGLPVPMIAVSSIVPALLGGVLYGLLRSLAPARARSVFLGIAVVFTLLSFAGPLGLAGASAGTKAALGVMHVIAAGAVVGSLLRRVR